MPCWRFLTSISLPYVPGDIKVFDFGLTKALLPSLKAKQSKMYNLTPITGSLPYSKYKCSMDALDMCSC